MEPVSLIVAALAAGAVAGAGHAASQAVQDAYAGLKGLVRRVLSGRPAGDVALVQHEAKPQQWTGALEAELVDAGAGQDAAVVAAARRLLELVDPGGARVGKYAVDVRDSQGVQIGDGNVQTNTFAPPGP